MDMDGNQNHRNPKSSILKPVPKSFPVVSFTQSNFFYLFKVVLTCLSKKLILIAFRPISGLFSMPSLFTYFIKICIDGHGRQSKSPKSKNFYPQASTKIISSCQVHSYKFLLSLSSYSKQNERIQCRRRVHCIVQ